MTAFHSSLHEPGIILPVLGSSLSIKVGGQYTFLELASALNQLCKLKAANVIILTLEGWSKKGTLKHLHLLTRNPKRFSDILLPLDIL